MLDKKRLNKTGRSKVQIPGICGQNTLA